MNDALHALAQAAEQHAALELEALTAGIPALERLAEAAQRHSGQAHHIRRLLLALYNGPAWPFEMSRLRALDLDLQKDALAVTRLATLGGSEIHTHLPDGNDLMVALWEREQE